MNKIPPDQDWYFLVGKEMQQLCIGQYDIQLKFAGDTSISIFGEEAAACFTHSSRFISASTVAGLPGGAVTLVSLLGASIQCVVPENETTLKLTFDNGEELQLADSSELYEAFTISSPSILIVV